MKPIFALRFCANSSRNDIYCCHGAITSCCFIDLMNRTGTPAAKMSDRTILEPEGALVLGGPARYPLPIIHHITVPSLINSVTLVPLSMSHIETLYPNIGGTQNAHMWQYIGAGPYYDLKSFSGFVNSIVESQGNVPFAVLKNGPTAQSADNGTPIGIISLGPIVPAHRTNEIGILVSPSLQRTTVATEAMYRLLKHCFEDLGYRRVE